jgi:predicted adenine nucleotide alpha hydrolase (AANH) superfamily ATPase
MEEFLRNTIGDIEGRCTYCYTTRLDSTAMAAKEHGFDLFSTSILYSRYQKHDLTRRIGEEVAEKHGIPFYYEDFRPGWREGITESKEMGLYRQQYCGCIYSEKERYLGARSG